RFKEFLRDTQEIGLGVVVNQSGWETVLENNKQAFTSEFVQRARFTTALPTSLSPTLFVNQLFGNAGVAADHSSAIAEFGGASNTTDMAARAPASRAAAADSVLLQQA